MDVKTQIPPALAPNEENISSNLRKSYVSSSANF